MSGSTGERSFADIITSIRYWIIHSITIPSLFIAGRTSLSIKSDNSVCEEPATSLYTLPFDDLSVQAVLSRLSVLRKAVSPNSYTATIAFLEVNSPTQATSSTGSPDNELFVRSASERRRGPLVVR
ncbi:hypothetical protein S83_051504 [Arachis hypogaea]